MGTRHALFPIPETIMGKTIALVCSGLIVAAGAVTGMYSYGVFCDGGDHGCCQVTVHDCCGASSGCCDSEQDATTTAALAVAGPVAAVPMTSQVSAGLPACCRAAAVKVNCCEDARDGNAASGVSAAVGVTATAK
jgi:hypothetical protein